MKVCILGLGYVGLVSAVCFGELGHKVIGVDVDKNKIERLKNGQPPFYEKDIDRLLKSNLKNKKLDFTTDIKQALKNADIVFNTVGTPAGKDRRVDLKYVKEVAKQVGQNLDHYIVFVNKSTVPVGTAKEVERIIKNNLKSNIEFDVASNPEFLREGSAIEDFMKPDRIIIGVDSKKSERYLKKLYQPLMKKCGTFMVTSTQNAELIKYASNSFLATKISFINEIADLCDKLGTDVTEIAKGMGLDSRIGHKFLEAGPGYGGSCFPKDIDALIYTALDNGVKMSILETVIETNKTRSNIIIQKLLKHLPDISNKTITVWGLSFKPNTDDIRESASLRIIEKILEKEAKIKCYDPMANEVTKKVFSNNKNIEFVSDKMDALDSTDALILMTHWDEFKKVKVKDIKKHTNIVIDTRNIWQRKDFEKLGIKYEGIGR